MAPAEVAVQEAPVTRSPGRVVNDFSIQVATVNGSGSQTANLVLLRSIFRMGGSRFREEPLPVQHSRPADLVHDPRQQGRLHRPHKKEIDFLVAMNPETAQEDVLSLEPGAAVVYDQGLALDKVRSDLCFYPVPFDKLVAGVCTDAKLRRLVRNMIYDGVLARLLEIDLQGMEQALQKQLGRKPKAVALNQQALEVGFAYAEQHFEKRDPYVIEAMDATAGKILIEGNAAAAIGAMMAGGHGGGVVPDNAIVLALRDAHRLPAEAPDRREDRQGHLRGGPGGRRGRGPRHDHRRGLGRRPGHDVDCPGRASR